MTRHRSVSFSSELISSCRAAKLRILPLRTADSVYGRLQGRRQLKLVSFATHGDAVGTHACQVLLLTSRHS